MQMRCRAGGESGLSLIEVIIIVAVLSILGAALAPVVEGVLSESRQAKAREDMQAIGGAIVRFLSDTGEDFFLQDGNGASATATPSHASTNVANMLIGDGDIPALGVARGAGTDWNTARDDAAVQTLAAHLILNTPSNLSANAYRSATNMSVTANFDPTSGATFNSEFAWRGPYLAGPVDPDPWGHRYAVNVEFLARIAGTNGPEGNVNDVVVLCAGPDGETDTAFAVDGVTPGDDDILFLVQGGTRS